MDDDIDPKQFVDDMHQPVCTSSEVSTALQYAGFSEVEIFLLKPSPLQLPNPDNQANPNGHWVIEACMDGTLSEVSSALIAILEELGLKRGEWHMDVHEEHQRKVRSFQVKLPWYQLEPSVSESIVQGLLEDATAKLPSKKAEIRILPARGLDLHHDVVLISDRAPLYIGTIGPKHSVWRVLKTAPNVGRLMRTQLHWHEPTKEECAIRMAEVMRPYWKPIIERHGFMDMFESGADVDPKETVCTSQAMAQFYRQRILDIEAELERLYRAVDNDHSGQPDALVKGEIIDLVSEHRVLKRRLGESEDAVDPKAYASDAPVTYRLGYVYYFDGDENDERYQKLGDYASLKEAYDAAISGNYTSRYATFIELFYGSHAEGKALAREFLITQDGELVDTATSEPVEIPESLADDIDTEAQKAEKPASDEQAEAGNYQKGHVSLQGLEIAIENAKGSTRSGVNKAGESWKVTMPAHYGYIKGTVGKDKDHLDVYIGDSPGGMLVFVVNQKKEEGGFDEHKIMLGFSSKDEAIEAYDRAFTGDLGPKLRESVVSTTVDKLKDWLKSGNTKKPFQNLAEAIVSALVEDDDIDPKGFAQKIPVRSLTEPVPAYIISDDTGQRIDFDARRGLDHLPDKSIEELRRQEFQTCELADRVASYGGRRVNDLQGAGPYEVYIDVEAAENYIPYRRRRV